MPAAARPCCRMSLVRGLQRGMVRAGRPSGVALRHLHRSRRRMSLDLGIVARHERDAGAAKQHGVDI